MIDVRPVAGRRPEPGQPASSAAALAQPDAWRVVGCPFGPVLVARWGQLAVSRLLAVHQPTASLRERGPLQPARPRRFPLWLAGLPAVRVATTQAASPWVHLRRFHLYTDTAASVWTRCPARSVRVSLCGVCRQWPRSRTVLIWFTNSVAPACYEGQFHRRRCLATLLDDLRGMWSTALLSNGQ
jgi:hypothetical protein